MMALSCAFPLLIGDKVPESDKHWESLLLLLKECAITLSPICTHETVAYLIVLIEEKLGMFKGLYPDMTAIPKQHYMIHCPSQVEKHGPLIHCWTTRQGAKLSFIKRASRQGKFKNICKTVTRKHQLWLCYQLQCEDHLLYQQPETNNNLTLTLLSSERDHLQTEL